MAGLEVREAGPRLAFALPIGSFQWARLKTYQDSLGEGPIEVAVGTLNIPPVPGKDPRTAPQLPPAQQLLNAYAKLRSLEAMPFPEPIPNHPLYISQATPLTPQEALWILETVAGMSGWQLDTSEPGKVSLKKVDPSTPK